MVASTSTGTITSKKSAVIGGPTSYQPVSRNSLATLNLVPGQPNPQNINTIYILRDLFLTLNLNFTLTAATTVAAVQPGDEWGPISNIQFTLNNGKIRTSLTGEQLVFLAWMESGFVRNVQITATVAGAVTTYNSWAAFVASAANAVGTVVNVKSVLPLPVKLFTTVKPLDFAINANLFSTLTITATFASIANFISTGATFNSCSIRVDSHEALARNIGSTPVFTFVETSVQATPLAANTTDYDINLPANTTYLRVFLNTKSSSNVDTVSLNKIQIRSSAYEPMDAHPWTELQAYFYNHGVQQSTLPFYNESFNLGAWSVYDFVRDGYVTEAYPLLGQKESGFKVSTGSNPCTLYAIMQKINQQSVVTTG
jgi:hypothetical protein